MEINQIWRQSIPKPDGQHANSIKELTFSPDGNFLFCIVSQILLVYNVENGQMICKPIKICPSLLSANEKLNTIAINKEGSIVATGGYSLIIRAQKTAVIYKFNIQSQKKLQPQLKFTQSDAIICMSFNPLTQQLFSGGVLDFAIYVLGQTNIPKEKTNEKITCCSWSADGQTLAYGTVLGTIVLRQRNMQQKCKIKKNNITPCWCMQWSPITSDNQQSFLYAGFCDQILICFNASGKQKYPQKKINCDPLCISNHFSGQYFLVSGTNKKLTMYSKQLGFLSEIIDLETWSWSSKIRPKSSDIVLTTDNGQISFYQVSKKSINHFYEQIYAIRQNLTDVVIQNVQLNQKVRIKCKQLVIKLAIYKQKIAVLQRQRLFIYASSDQNMKYKPYKKLNKKFDCNWMSLTSHHVIFAKEKKIQLFNFFGQLQKQWILSNQLSFLQIIGGSPNRQCFLIGNQNGQIQQIFIDNSFPISLWTQNSTVIYANLNLTKKKLALIDKNKNLLVVDLVTHALIFQEMGIDSFSWNTQIEDMIAFSGNQTLGIRTGNLPAITQKSDANIASFSGFKLYIFKNNNLVCMDVSHTPTIMKFVDKKDFKQAYKIASLGAPENDIRLLGIEAFQYGDYQIAMKCFVKIKDLPFIYLTQKYQKLTKQGQFNEMHLKGEVLAYQGKYNQAAIAYQKANSPEKAVEMFIQLKQWDEALKYMPKGLLLQQAQWMIQSGDWRKASGIFISIKQYSKAIDIYIQNDYLEGLIQICRIIDVSEKKEDIQKIASYFKDNKHNSYAKQAYIKLGDLKSILMMYIELQNWEDAFILSKQNIQFLDLVKQPYANWLIKNDQHQKALIAYQSLGKSEIISKMLFNLSKNAVEQKRFEQATRFYYMIAKQQLRMIRNFKSVEKQQKQLIQKYNELKTVSQLYYAYSKISNFIQSPFFDTSRSNVMSILNSCIFIISKIGNISINKFKGINRNYIYYGLAKVSQQLEAYKTTRLCLQKLSNFKIPNNWIQQVDLNQLLIRSKPFSDKQEIQPLCYRCLTLNPIILDKDQCFNCKHQFVCSMNSYQILPLVEFQVHERIKHTKVLQLLNSQKVNTISGLNKKTKKSDGWSQTKRINLKLLKFENYTNAQSKLRQLVQSTIFYQKMVQTLQQQLTSLDYVPIILDQEAIQTMTPDQVMYIDMRKFNLNKQIVYYKNMIPDVLIKSCNECFKFFLLVFVFNKDEYEFEYNQTGKCMFCKATDKRSNQKEIFEI